MIFSASYECLQMAMCLGKGPSFGVKEREKGHGILGDEKMQSFNAHVYSIHMHLTARGKQCSITSILSWLTRLIVIYSSLVSTG